ILKIGNFLVAVGSMKIEVEKKELIRIKTGKGRETSRKAVLLHHELNNTEKPAFELDLRGLRLDESIIKLEKQLDSALVNGLTTFSVIHGLGEGILKKAVTEYLSENPAVKKFYFAHPDSGGFGKTIIEL
ncbi:MAG: Smr/MutS family protein, partial [Spirochaetia bacterium]|nr:Smr/MutS family protein [Spirochaetia bacterium]